MQTLASSLEILVHSIQGQRLSLHVSPSWTSRLPLRFAGHRRWLCGAQPELAAFVEVEQLTHVSVGHPDCQLVLGCDSHHFLAAQREQAVVKEPLLHSKRSSAFLRSWLFQAMPRSEVLSIGCDSELAATHRFTHPRVAATQVPCCGATPFDFNACNISAHGAGLLPVLMQEHTPHELALLLCACQSSLARFGRASWPLVGWASWGSGQRRMLLAREFRVMPKRAADLRATTLLIGPNYSNAISHRQCFQAFWRPPMDSACVTAPRGCCCRTSQQLAEILVNNQLSS